jgi:hypothetical protein
MINHQIKKNLASSGEFEADMLQIKKIGKDNNKFGNIAR